MKTKLLKRGGAIALAITTGLSAFLFAPRASAQTPIFAPQPITVFTTLAAGAGTNMANPPYIDVSKQQNVAFSAGNAWSTAGNAGGSTNITYYLAPTDDGILSHCASNQLVTIGFPNFQTTLGIPAWSTTNLAANGHKGWFVLAATNNSVGGTATNLGLVYTIKIGAP